nr:hypothetical chloroplast RF1 [Abutilon megapotamicum]
MMILKSFIPGKIISSLCMKKSSYNNPEIEKKKGRLMMILKSFIPGKIISSLCMI